MEEGVAVARVVGRDALGEHAVVELEARLLHRDQHPVVAAHPRDVAGPAPALHVEAPVLPTQFLDHRVQPLRAIAGCHPGPDTVLEQRLDGGQVRRADAGGVQLLEVLGHVHGRRPGV